MRELVSGRPSARILVLDPSFAFSRSLASLLQRFSEQVLWAKTIDDAKSQLADGPIDLVLVDEERWNPSVRGLAPANVPLMLVTSPLPVDQIIERYASGIACCLVKPWHARELVASIHAMLHGQRRLVCLGGGTGLYTLLLGLKMLPGMHLTSIVSMSDDGGSSGRIREAFGILPPGDVRRSLVALSTAPAVLNELMQYRFEEGAGLKDHNLGNLLLTAMASLKGNMAEAVRAMGDILSIQGSVIPVTTTPNTLMAELADGTMIFGERNLDVPEGRDPQVRIARVWQEPAVDANPDAVAAILAADAVLLGPGDLFTSIVPTLTVRGIAHAIRATKARTVHLCNLMTKPGETTGFTVADHVREIVRYLGADALDDVLISNSAVSAHAIQQYAQNGQELVQFDGESAVRGVTQAKLTLADVGSDTELVRHDSFKLAGALAALLELPA